MHVPFSTNHRHCWRTASSGTLNATTCYFFVYFTHTHTLISLFYLYFFNSQKPATDLELKALLVALTYSTKDKDNKDTVHFFSTVLCNLSKLFSYSDLPCQLGPDLSSILLATLVTLTN